MGWMMMMMIDHGPVLTRSNIGTAQILNDLEASDVLDTLLTVAESMWDAHQLLAPDLFFFFFFLRRTRSFLDGWITGRPPSRFLSFWRLGIVPNVF